MKSQPPQSAQESKNGFDVHQYDDNPLLNYDGLVEACNQIFPGGQTISRKKYQELVAKSYRIDMESYARLHNFTDAVDLTNFFSKIVAAMPAEARTNRILVVGCGQGRLAEVYIALAKKHGIQEIIQNDLIPDHVAATREKIQKIYGNDGSDANGVKITYAPGNILDANIQGGPVDAAYLLWFVGAEFCDPSSDKKLTRTRHRIYRRIHDLLVPGGGMIEDSPDPNMKPGFFYTLAQKTAHILKQRNIMPRQQSNMILNNWSSEQPDGFPYQIRCVPKNGADAHEKEKAGFTYVTSLSTSIPEKSDYRSADTVVHTIEETDNIGNAIDTLNLLKQKTVQFPDITDPFQKRRVIKWWER